jgi:hypothetical protein
MEIITFIATIFVLGIAAVILGLIVAWFINRHKEDTDIAW